LHTQDAASTVDRIISEFPPAQQARARLQVSNVLNAVISQVLMPRVGGGRVCAREVMLMNSGIASLIRDAKIHQILSSIEGGKEEGMFSLDQQLAELCAQKVIDVKMAYSWAHEISSLKAQLVRLNVPLPAEVAEYVAPV
jgi:twitching motility protein PilT